MNALPALWMLLQFDVKSGKMSAGQINLAVQTSIKYVLSKISEKNFVENPQCGRMIIPCMENAMLPPFTRFCSNPILGPFSIGTTWWQGVLRHLKCRAFFRLAFNPLSITFDLKIGIGKGNKVQSEIVGNHAYFPLFFLCRPAFSSSSQRRRLRAERRERISRRAGSEMV